MTEVRHFFGSNENAIKEKAKPKQGYFGYFGVGGETTLGKKDWKEGMYYRAEYPNEHSKRDTKLNAINYWPDEKHFPKLGSATSKINLRNLIL